MSTATLAAPGDVIADRADRICHIICTHCWEPGMPVMCGMPDDGSPDCPIDCKHRHCSMCEVDWETHQCPE